MASFQQKIMIGCMALMRRAASSRLLSNFGMRTEKMKHGLVPILGATILAKLVLQNAFDGIACCLPSSTEIAQTKDCRKKFLRSSMKQSTSHLIINQCTTTVSNAHENLHCETDIN